MTFSLLVMSRPSPPVPAPCSLKLRIVLIGPLAADGHVADVERERGAEVEPALAELDDVAGLGVDQRRLDPLRGALAGLDPSRPGRRLARFGRIDLDARRPLLTADDQHRDTNQGHGGNVHDAHVRPPRRSPLPAGPAHEPRFDNPVRGRSPNIHRFYACAWITARGRGRPLTTVRLILQLS